MRTLFLLTLLAAVSPASTIFGPGGGGFINCAPTGGGMIISPDFALAMGSGSCPNPGQVAFVAGGVAAGTATGGPVYVGWDLGFSGGFAQPTLSFSLNNFDIFTTNVVGPTGYLAVGGLPAGFSMHTYQMHLDAFATAPNSIINVNRLYISEIPFGDGSSQGFPLPPSGGSSGNWIFSGLSGRWYDPPLVDGFDYTGTGGTTFTQIGLPTGFASNFIVSHGPGGGTVLGTFGGGTLVDFVALTGGAVNSFRITGIAPLVDAANPNAFPLQVFFSNSTGSFTQSALVPEPGTNAMIASALIALGCLRRRYTCRTPNEPN